MLKESDNPPITWPQDRSIQSFEGRWWVVHTKSRNEKALAHDLIARNISYFLPMTWHLRRSRGRKFKSLLPLFKGYMFCCCDQEQRLQIFTTNRVANILNVENQENLIAELSQIQQAIISGADLSPHDYVKVGQKCRVTAGPLENLEGIVKQTSRNKASLILQVNMLGQAASVEIDTSSIEPID